jgi:hypothetical protein
MTLRNLIAELREALEEAVSRMGAAKSRPKNPKYREGQKMVFGKLVDVGQRKHPGVPNHRDSSHYRQHNKERKGKGPKPTSVGHYAQVARAGGSR